MFDKNFGHCVVEDVSEYLHILTLEVSVVSERLSFLLECKLILRRLLVLRNPLLTFAAVICDADKACSVNTA